MTEDASEEAAWRELVAHYATPAVADGTPTPWPTREDLPAPGARQDRPGPESGTPGAAPGGGTPGGGALDGGGRDGGPADPGGPDTADLDVTGMDMSGREAAGFGGPAAEGADGAGPQAPEGHLPPGGAFPGPPHLRIVRPASTPPPDDDDHFVPPVPPPLPRLDPVTKGAWAGLFGGPAYLLIAVMLHWQVPGWAAFAAVAAFVGGFAALIVRMGDRPPRDSGPDDGAVV